MIELSQAPVNEPQPPVLVIDHHVVRLDVSVHDPHAVTVVQSPQQLVQIKSEKIVIKVTERWGSDLPDVKVSEGLIKLLEVSVVDMLEDEGGGPADGILHYAVKSDHIRAAPKIL